MKIERYDTNRTRITDEGKTRDESSGTGNNDTIQTGRGTRDGENGARDEGRKEERETANEERETTKRGREANKWNSGGELLQGKRKTKVVEQHRQAVTTTVSASPAGSACAACALADVFIILPYASSVMTSA